MTPVRGGGSLRERRSGVWEVRVSLGADPVSGRSRVRSLTVHGDWEVADAARDRWAADAAVVRFAGRARPGITVAHLLEVWLTADHGWRPSTLGGYRSAAGFLARDRIGCRRAIDVSPLLCSAQRARPGALLDGRTRRSGPGCGCCARDQLFHFHRHVAHHPFPGLPTQDTDPEQHRILPAAQPCRPPHPGRFRVQRRHQRARRPERRVTVIPAARRVSPRPAQRRAPAARRPARRPRPVHQRLKGRHRLPGPGRAGMTSGVGLPINGHRRSVGGRCRTRSMAICLISPVLLLRRW